jgi:hypothetical protein
MVAYAKSLQIVVKIDVVNLLVLLEHLNNFMESGVMLVEHQQINASIRLKHS